MIGRYGVVAGRICQELEVLDRVVARTERAIAAAQQRPEDQDLYIDAAALNLHDFYAGLERTFRLIAAVVDQSVPSGHDWNRELLRLETLTSAWSTPTKLARMFYRQVS